MKIVPSHDSFNYYQLSKKSHNTKVDREIIQKRLRKFFFF